MRPRLVVMVTGTGTEVGKTWVSVELIKALRGRGLRVAARKPAQSYDADDPARDADLLGEAAGEAPSTVCPEHRWYPVPMAPPMAAAALGRTPPLLSQLLDELASSWTARAADVGLVEGAGGVASPMATDGDSAALAKSIAADLVVLVADPGLGTINNVRMSARALEPLPVVVYLNRFDPGQEIHAMNRSWLSEVDGLQLSSEGEDLARRIVERLED